MFLTWLPDVLRAAGVPVYVLPGAETRTTRKSGLASIGGIVWHHTATGPNWQDGHVAALLRDGRRDLPGPLAQVGIERDGTWVIVALGRANHNGYGTWGNNSIGLEFYNDGRGEPYPPEQYVSGVRGTAAILRHLGRSATSVKGHKETDPTRKIDPRLNMGTVRADVTNTLTTLQKDEDDMPPYIAWIKADDGTPHAYNIYPASGLGKHLDSEALSTARYLQAKEVNAPGNAWARGLARTLILVDGPASTLPATTTTSGSPGAVAAEFARRLAA